jgi:hypothetical protein
MLAHLSGRISERQLRRFTAACCRRIWPLLPEPRSDFRDALDLCERLADQAPVDSNRARLYTAAAAACAAFAAAAAESSEAEAQSFAAHAVFAAAALTGIGYADEEAMIWSVAADAAAADEYTKSEAERAAQAELLRNVFGNPFRRT